MTDEIRIIGLLIRDRIKESGRTQEVLTKNSHLIQSRLGFHEVSEDICSRVGVIILQLTGSQEECERMESELREIGGIELQRMVFNI
ncbi:MAG: hypothetical protein IH596_14740 [Bacteroidales bacterium]|nr:hypothetical protein [Bacteroidales bacterium]